MIDINFAGEMFRTIPYSDEYAVSSTGKAISLKWGTTRVLKQQPNGRCDHLTIGTHINGQFKILSIHRLVLECFVGPCLDGMECGHLDGNPYNNDVSNLQWGTQLENQRDRATHGTSNLGKKYGPRSEQFKEKLRIRMTGSKLSEQTKVKIGNASRERWQRIKAAKVK